MSKSACSSIPALLLLSALCTGLGACGDDAASSPGKKPAPTCGPGKYCVRPESCIEGQCRRIGTVCEKDDDCAVGYLCEQNACVEPCRSDIQCPQGENLYCDQATGRCREIPRRCQNVLDCSEGQVCIDNQCIAPPPCVDDESCHPGVCIEGRCYECREASDCIRSVDAGTAEEYLCQENRCIPFAGRCSAADPCPGGQLCQAGHCLEPPRCTADVDCFQEQGRYCFQEHCTDRCDPLARTGCPAGWRCQEDGRCELVPCEESGCLEGLECREGICQPPKSCTEDPTICRGRQTCVGGSCTEPLVCESDADCLGERYCLEAWNTRSCTDPCLDENDCPGAKICHEVTHHCVDPQAICRSHDECLQGEVCEGGECRAQLPGECRNDGDCPRSERCIGTSCTLPPVPACVEDRQCPPGMVCGALEACEAPARCTADGQCPTGMKCNRGLARCAECVSDRDCGEGRSCEPLPGFDYFGCSEPPFCSKDEDCRGERTCNVRLAVCENPACAEDDSAPNHFPAMALPVTSRTIPGRMLCSGRDDWYRVTLEEGWGLVATLTTDPRGPDINVEIYEQADLVRPLARGSHIGGVEQATLGRAEVDGIYFIRVFAPLGFSVAYTLRVQVERAGACARDGMEGPRGNDDPLQAVRIGSGLYAGTICPGDVDHFTLELDEGLDLVVRLLPAAGVELTMALTREGTPVAEPVRTEQGLLLDLEGVQGGSYLVRLAGAAAQTEGSYRLQVYYPLSAAELLAICDDAQPLVPGTTAEGTTAEVGRVNGFTGSCDDDLPLGTEAVYLLDLAEDSEVSIDLSAGFDALLYLRQDCLDDAQEIFCEETTEQILRLRHLAAGSYYLVVDGQHAESGPFRLRVEASPSRLHPPANDSCQAPERLAFPDFAERSIAGTSVDALSNTALSCHPGTANGPDVVYALELGQDSRVTALLQTEGLSAALALTSGSCVRGEERACSFNDGLRQSLFFDLLPAGTYHLWVDGTSVVQQGRFTLTVRV
ncbi:MAG: hypothetical protein FJ125_05105, partial [Deltaproteobacteria bacterium]|nr:hypothetical protein [Deltaproteobacteria bacterium]